MSISRDGCRRFRPPSRPAKPTTTTICAQEALFNPPESTVPATDFGSAPPARTPAAQRTQLAAAPPTGSDAPRPLDASDASARAAPTSDSGTTHRSPQSELHDRPTRSALLPPPPPHPSSAPRRRAAGGRQELLDALSPLGPGLRHLLYAGAVARALRTLRPAWRPCWLGATVHPSVPQRRPRDMAADMATPQEHEGVKKRLQALEARAVLLPVAWRYARRRSS